MTVSHPHDALRVQPEVVPGLCKTKLVKFPSTSAVLFLFYFIFSWYTLSYRFTFDYVHSAVSCQLLSHSMMSIPLPVLLRCCGRQALYWYSPSPNFTHLSAGMGLISINCGYL